jgi:hypothetical protein
MGDRINYLMSRYVTQSPATEATFQRDVSFAAQYLEAFRGHGERTIDDALFYEFGAGWDLSVPLSYYSLGANRQLVADVCQLAPAVTRDVDRQAIE